MNIQKVLREQSNETNDIDRTLLKKWLIENTDRKSSIPIKYRHYHLEELWNMKNTIKNEADGPDLLLRYSDIIKLLDKEQDWCINNPIEQFSQEYRNGFVNGLIQAKHLVTAIRDTYEESGEFIEGSE